ncbi:Hypothetical protein LUCI_1769 [Lucifera butyrica]|uniref:Uncharacterized protein n=1 Tax=Lucifera butyrica TaxID=1351585 RepID=A0A498R8N3_9FIRM|nr:hypothetical protein [Lucifera butyrica]VBB06533.1 Hypothetical protein LUCI_1769 [Lucifera butyrica]
MLKKAILLSAFLTVSTSVCLADTNTQTLETSWRHYHYGYSEVIGDSETSWLNGFHLSYKNQDDISKKFLEDII